jgi:CxxC-x17-CxxC domain-containing protein
MAFADRDLLCVSCGVEFVFSAGEQAFFQTKGFTNDPKHCKQCHSELHGKQNRVTKETKVACAECRSETTVPFKPTQGRPVLCRSCFSKQPTSH